MCAYFRDLCSAPLACRFYAVAVHISVVCVWLCTVSSDVVIMLTALFFWIRIAWTVEMFCASLCFLDIFLVLWRSLIILMEAELNIDPFLYCKHFNNFSNPETCKIFLFVPSISFSSEFSSFYFSWFSFSCSNLILSILFYYSFLM